MNKTIKLEIHTDIEANDQSPSGLSIKEVRVFYNDQQGPFFNPDNTLNPAGINLFLHMLAQGVATTVKMGEEQGMFGRENFEQTMQWFQKNVLKAMNKSGRTEQTEFPIENQN